MGSRRMSRPRRGATLAMVACSMLVLIGMLAMVADAAYLYVRRQAHVTACDAAALAGAQALSAQWSSGAMTSGWNLSAANTVARTVASANLTGGASPTITATASTSPTVQMVVQTEETAPLFFARVLGRKTKLVSSRARAIVGRANVVRGNSEGGLRPFGVPDTYTLQYGVQVTLKRGSQDATASGGNYYPVVFPGYGSGASVYRDVLLHGVAGTYAVGDWLTTEPGNQQGPTSQAITDILALANQPPWNTQTWSTATFDNPRMFLTPIVHWSGVNGRTDVQIKGFAIFYVTGFQNGTNGGVTGIFRQFLDANNLDFDSSYGAATGNSGALIVKLIE